MANNDLFEKAYKLARRLNAEKEYKAPLAPLSKTSKKNRSLVDSHHFRFDEITLGLAARSITREFIDFSIPCVMKKGLTARRIYSSSSSGGLFGKGWVSEYESAAALYGEKLRARFADGLTYEFTLKNEHWVNSDPNSLARAEINRRITIEKNAFLYDYDSEGRLLSVFDKNKNSVELTYFDKTRFIERAVSSCGKSLLFEYAHGKVSKITDNIGRSILYRYENDMLSAVTLPNGGVYKFEYDAKHRKLSSITDANGVLEFFCRYGRHGEYAEIRFAGESSWLVKYNEIAKTISFLDKDIIKFQFTVDREGVIKKVVSSDGTSITRDASVVCEADADGLKKYFTYDNYGRRIKSVFTDGSWEQTTFDAENGLPVKCVKSNGYEKILGYDKNCNLMETREKIDAASVSSNKFEYDSKGRLIARTDALKHVITYNYKNDASVFSEETIYDNGFRLKREYDAVSRLTMIDDDGVKTKFEYNGMDSLIRSIYNNGLTDFRRYGLMCELKEAASPKCLKDGGKYRYFYDERYDAVKLVTPSGKTLTPAEEDITSGPTLKRDYAGNIVEKIIAQDDSLYTLYRYVYNKNMSVTEKRINFDITAEERPGYFMSETYEYDGRGNLKTIRINTGREITFFYKAKNTLIKKIDSINESKKSKTLYKYDSMGLLSEKIELIDADDSVCGECSLVTSFEYDENNMPVKITLPDGEQAVIQYDADGCPLKKGWDDSIPAPPDGSVKIRDKFGRVVKKTYSDGAFEMFKYDLVGNISESVDKNGLKTRYTYNSVNKLKFIENDHGINTILYSRDGKIARRS
ncbi:MAG: hypothetical protein LBL35_01565 [Clostridiales bacterium]|jgi:YD repeat-containing protein|nr:hypothetical protein [Clostridiales bacterium]